MFCYCHVRNDRILSEFFISPCFSPTGFFRYLFLLNLQNANYKLGDSSAAPAPTTPPPAAAAAAPASGGAPATAPAGNYPAYEVIDLPALSPTMEQACFLILNLIQHYIYRR